ncbi:hypothetical protein [Haloarcula salinisoli]|uniref:Uncharacterized protein n=1 Tax=Haloarcula salinisoli TaxID=2487746 RepID=A0A8J8C9Z6_9EURY|nr:hypothetical protein [Halomicroarcula salinisoli]MBX0304739.1 hypothetical protein [Halomicroarcula salinisoli]
MRFPLFALLLVVSATLVGSTPAVAQSANQADASPQPTAASTTERIDNQTTIVESRIVTEGNRSVVRLTLRSESAQAISISDASRFRQGGEVPVRTVVMKAGETATYEIPINSSSGYVALSISTEQTPLYAEILQRPASESSGLDVLRALTSIQAWFAGAFVAFTWVGLAAYTVVRRTGQAPEVAT